MSAAPDIKQLLTIATEADRVEGDPLADLERGRVAKVARTRRRVRGGLTGLALVTVMVTGVAGVLSERGADSGTTPAATVELVADEFEATPYIFDLTPVGWSAQGQQPTAVTIAPMDGSASDDPNDFRGKLVILFDVNPPDGRLSSYHGRSIWISEDSGYVTMATRTRDGEPYGVVRIQYPRNAGWEVSAMQAFLASVHVGTAARHGLG